MSTITIEPDGEAELGPCADCGFTTRSVWGYAYDDGACIAAYFARWTIGHHPREPFHFLLSVGRWGDGAEPSMRRSIGVECRMGQDRPGFMIIDADALNWGKGEVLGAALTRAEAMIHPSRDIAFSVLDRVVFDDPRVHAFLTRDGS